MTYHRASWRGFRPFLRKQGMNTVNTGVYVLTEARKLLEKGWTQGALARDKDGNPVHYNCPSAKSFDIAGAILRQGNFYGGNFWAAKALDIVFGDRVARKNDGVRMTQLRVLMGFDFAILIAKEGL
jgi:hypothetical protein